MTTNLTFPVIQSLPLGIIIDNFLPNADPYVDINYELATLILRCRNVHLIAHVQQLSDTRYRLWRIEDWDSIKEIRDAKKKEQLALSQANGILSDKFQEVKAYLTTTLGADISHRITLMLFAAKSSEERKNIAGAVNVDLSEVEQYFGQRSETYEVVTYKGKEIKLW